MPTRHLPLAVQQFRAAIGPGGRGVIAHSAAHGHYVEFHRRYLEAFGPEDAVPYISAQDLVAALRAAGAEVAVTELRYDSVAAPDATAAVEGYLQRCVFDDSVSLTQMRATEPLAGWIAACHHAEAWRFPQVVHLLDITG